MSGERTTPMGDNRGMNLTTRDEVQAYFRAGIEALMDRRMVTSFVVVVETVNEEGKYEITSVTDSDVPVWRSVALLNYVLDNTHYPDPEDDDWP
jgi:hypothetical protein